MKSGATLFCAATLLVLAAVASAQGQSATFDTLYDFTATSGAESNNLDGAFPEAPLLLSGTTFYGTAINGGAAGNGTLFRITTAGSNFFSFYSFSAGGTDFSGAYTNSDGATPFAGLILAGDTLFGTTASGGKGGAGTVFRINTNGSDFTNLHSFTATSGAPYYTNLDGANPAAGVVLVGNTLYGTAQNGGDAGNGTIFKIDADGSNFSLVHTFSFGADNASGIYTNGDGAVPVAALMISGRTLFGTAEYGGSGGSGTVFGVNIDDLNFITLHGFSPTTYDPVLALDLNGDGAFPVSGLLLSSNTLYGTAQKGGRAGTGAVFSLQTNGSAFTNLHNFSAPSYNATLGDYTNTDGFFPLAPLALSGDELFGTAENGGNGDVGTIFSLQINGSNFVTLYNFSPGLTNAAGVFTNSGGALPVAGLTLAGSAFFGAAAIGGAQGDGTLFTLILPAPPSLAIAPSGRQVLLSWPASASNYVLQAATALAYGGWIDITNGINVIGSNNVVTVTASGPAAFYRLRQN